MAQKITGTRWHKCDLHLHTPASTCFKDQTITPEKWVEEAIIKGLDCIAVTDHNTGEWIDKIKAAAKNTNLTVFPGVEITCSDAKIHLLVLFDTDKGTTDVEDFLISVGIKRNTFGQQDAHTNTNLEDVAKKAEEAEAIVIPAHIDEFNGLFKAGNDIRKHFLNLENIQAVQVVHRDFLIEDTKYTKTFKDSLSDKLTNYYGTKIDESQIKDCRQAVKQSLQYGKAILTFSDNPDAPNESKHGLWGIGNRYTWIKMDQCPNLESLRQAILLPKFRIRNDFDCEPTAQPYQLPNLWIQSITVNNTEITGHEKSLHVDFSPQMTTIIGGRGSGKSSILSFLRGVFSKDKELNELESIKKEFSEFFKQKDKNLKGVLRHGSTVDVIFNRKSETYKINFTWDNINKPPINIFRFNSESKLYEDISDEGFLDFFQFDIFSQKQIYDIATKPNSLRKRIDESEVEISQLNNTLEEKRREYKQQSSIIRTLEQQVSSKGKLETQIKDIEFRIDAYNKSGVNELLRERQRFVKEKTIIETFAQSLAAKINSYDFVINNLEISPLQLADFHDLHANELYQIADTSVNGLQIIKADAISSKEKLEKIKEEFEDSINKSGWSLANKQSLDKFEKKKLELVQEGINDLTEIEQEMILLKKKKEELFIILEKEKKLRIELSQKLSIKKEYIEIRINLSKLRKAFLEKILKDRNVKAEVKPFRDTNNYEQHFRAIINNENGFEEDITNILEKWQSSNAIKVNQEIIDSFKRVIEESIREDFTGRFVNKINNLNGEQLDDIDLLFPEDEIIIKYRSSKSIQYKSISNASAGQKTAAILTLLLSHGNIPLALDQPEDDLDNYLIYDLVVDQLLHSKDFRQIIVVTHNANIPVNGDSEHVIVMNSESKFVEPSAFGSIEKEEIKKAICDVMEGGKIAFEMRSKRYQSIKADLN